MTTSVLIQLIDQKKEEIQVLYQELKDNNVELNREDLSDSDKEVVRTKKDEILFSIYLIRKSIRDLTMIHPQVAWL